MERGHRRVGGRNSDSARGIHPAHPRRRDSSSRLFRRLVYRPERSVARHAWVNSWVRPLRKLRLLRNGRVENKGLPLFSISVRLRIPLSPPYLTFILNNLHEMRELRH